MDYFVATVDGMLFASFAYRALPSSDVICAKPHRDRIHRCIFRYGYADAANVLR